MITTNALSVFLLHHHLNGLGNKNLYSIQDVMCASEPAAVKFKRVCEDFPNLAIFTKSATLGDIQLMFDHAAVGNKSLGESVVSFALTSDLSSPSVISLKIEIAFAAYGNKIRLPIAEVFLRAAAGDLARSKNQRDWTPHNVILLPPFLTEAAILHSKSDAGKLLNIFTCSITEWASDPDSTSEEDEDKGDNSVVTIEAEEANAKPGKAEQASAKTAAAKTLATIAGDCEDVLAFLQVVSVNILESLQPHSPFARASALVSGSNAGQT